jgi:hypothetical protein
MGRAISPPLASSVGRGADCQVQLAAIDNVVNPPIGQRVWRSRQAVIPPGFDAGVKNSEL